MTKFLARKEFTEGTIDPPSEVLQNVYKMLTSIIEYTSCNCGCPMKRSPATRKDVELMRIQSYMRCYSDIKFE